MNEQSVVLWKDNKIKEGREPMIKGKMCSREDSSMQSVSKIMPLSVAMSVCRLECRGA